MPKVKETRAPLPSEDPRRVSDTAQSSPRHNVKITISSDGESGSSGQSAGSTNHPQEAQNTTRPDPRAIERRKPVNLPVASDSESQNGSESESSAESSDSSSVASPSESARGLSEEEREREQKREVVEPTTQAPKSPHAQPQSSELRSQKPYQPPVGFYPLQSRSTSSSEVWNMFRPSNLIGKEIWHITVPESLPINSITEVSLDAIVTGHSVIRHEGVDYSFSKAASEEACGARAVLPNSSGDAYNVAQTAITQELHLEQVLPLFDADKHTGKSQDQLSGASVQRPALTNFRLQPKGLKMRCFPSGFDVVKPRTSHTEYYGQSTSDQQKHSRKASSPEQMQKPRKRKLENLRDASKEGQLETTKKPRMDYDTVTQPEARHKKNRTGSSPLKSLYGNGLRKS